MGACSAGHQGLLFGSLRLSWDKEAADDGVGLTFSRLLALDDELRAFLLNGLVSEEATLATGRRA